MKKHLFNYSKHFFNYSRYVIALIIFIVIFYSPSLIIDNSFIEEAIASKVPYNSELKKKKKKVNYTIDRFEINKIESKIVYLTVQGNVRYKNSKKIFGKKIKFSKTLPLSIDLEVIPKLNKHILSFDLKRINVKKKVVAKIIEKPFKKEIQKAKIKIKKLKRLNYLVEIRNISFQDDGSLLVNYKLSNWLALLIILFLFFEIKYLLRLK